MAKVKLANRAKQSCTSPGTGAFTFSGTVIGHQSFEDGGIEDGDIVYYGAETTDRTVWEVGRGTYDAGSGELSRDEIFDSSDGGTIIDFSGGIGVWVDAPRQYLDENERTHTAAGDVTVADDDDIIYVNKSSGAATGVALPAVAARSSKKPLTIVDAKGDASSNNITLTPNGAETIVGLATWVIDADYGKITLRPFAAGSKWLIV